MNKHYEEICELLNEQERKILKKGDINAQDLDNLYKLSAIVTDYETSDLTSAWYDDFTAWLYDKQGLKRNSVGKQVKVLKSILRKRIPMAQRGSCEFIVPRKCQVVRDKASDINAVFLNEEQLKVIAEQTLSPKLAAQRDLFLLQCWTGQRYSDLGKLVAENIRTTKKGNHRYFSIGRAYPTRSRGDTGQVWRCDAQALEQSKV